MHDAEHQDNSVLLEHVVHHAVVADTKPVERVAHTLDRLDGLPFDATVARDAGSKLLQSATDPGLDILGQLLEGACRRRGDLDAVRGQARSFRLVVRPFA